MHQLQAHRAKPAAHAFHSSTTMQTTTKDEDSDSDMRHTLCCTDGTCVLFLSPFVHFFLSLVTHPIPFRLTSSIRAATQERHKVMSKPFWHEFYVRARFECIVSRHYVRVFACISEHKIAHNLQLDIVFTKTVRRTMRSTT